MPASSCQIQLMPFKKNQGVLLTRPRVLEKSYINTKENGSSTAFIIALTDQGLHAINLGDSGFMMVRDGCAVFRSPVQRHDFNFTYQLENGNAGDLPSSGQVFTVTVAPGDVIIAGTDGLFDNLYNSDITAVVVHAVRAGLGPQVTAQKIAALARQRAQDKNRQTPFSTAAQEAGFRYYGGKLDDITVVVSYIASDHNSWVVLHVIYLFLLSLTLLLLKYISHAIISDEPTSNAQFGVRIVF
ncbi:Protein phosphatase 2C family protein [Perilla frutescens var. hirtella]|uniref:Protein phosphatase n=1 Tax=Perilla frutescens var. hirtella TaxID=608512 RepID=A0AAD4JF76_PERFH|nr:Protein phosphatase 2C family protein [Perilla frutescens var. hirtella]